MNAPIDVTTLRLGAKPPRHDPRTLRLARYLAELPTPLSRVDWGLPVPAWPMYLNDQLGCCTCSSAADQILTWTTNAGTPRPAHDGDVLAAYEAVSGYRPERPETDQGAVELDVLNYWRRVGIGGHRITAYTALDHTDHRQVRQAISLFGGVYIGAALPTSARGQIAAGQPWRVVRGERGEPGSWGGHAVVVVAYNRSGLSCVTWGRRQRMTWAWWDRYVVESYGLVSVDWLNAAGHSPQGLDLSLLLSDLAAVTGS